jgi:hypothetical protein
MIETGAKALYEEGCRRAIAVGMMKPDGVVAWADLADSSRRDYRTSFRAAFTSVRDLDSGFSGLPVLVAGKKALYSCSEDPEIEDARNCWHAMIDAALQEPTDDAHS